MKKQNYRLKHKLFVSLVLASFAITSFSPFFSNNVSAMSLNFEEKLPTKLKAAPTKEEAAKMMSNTPIQFEENRGQFDKKVRFASRRANSTVFLTATEAVMTHKVSEKKNFALKMKLVNANQDAKSFGSEEKVSKSNYFRGNDASKWQTDVSTFGRANYQEVYQGIDMAWYGNTENELEYDFIVKPNADYRQIELKFSGSKRLKIDENGDLLIETKAGTITQRKPYTYQTSNGEKQEVESRYELVGKNKVKFLVSDYDKSRELVVDPTLLKYASYLGGSEQDYPTDMAVDGQGNIYIAGTTPSADFPTTTGAFDTTLNANRANIFISKINSDGGLQYSTFLGGTNGSYGENGNAIAIDSSGNAYVVGETNATDYPVTLGSYDTTKNGTIYTDAVITKLNSTGSALVYSTYLGSLSSDSAHDIQVDSNGVARILGESLGSSFPLTPNAASTSGGSFYANLSSDGRTLSYSTKIAGTNFDDAKKIVIDSSGNSLILGATSSSAFPATANAYDTTFNGGEDIFLMKVTSNGAISYATYLGGSSYEGINNGMDITLDNVGNIFLLVAVGSADFPRTSGALTRPMSGYEDFLVKFNSQINTLLLSTPLGPNQNIFGSSISVDSKGNIYVWGEANFDTFVGNCTYDYFIAKYAADGTTLKNLKCFEGSGFGSTNKVFVDTNENIYLLANTYSNLPVTPNAFDRTNNSNDAWIAKVKLVSQSIPNDFDADGKSDMAVYRNGMWHVNQSLWGYQAQPFGLATDTPVPGDYDGDGKTDYAVFRPSNVSGQPDFYVMKSTTNTVSGVAWGSVGDTPVPADYDGDGKVDFGVYRQGTDGDFYVLHQTGTGRHYRFGVMGDKPVVADYDGDNKADFAVFRPSNGTWYVNNSSNDVFNYSSWGVATDKLVPADYDGDGKTDLAVYRESEGIWYINQSSNGQMKAQQWGLSTDKPVPGDYDGDGKTDVAVYRDGQWLIMQSSNNSPSLGNWFGNATDIPVENLSVR